MTDAPAFGVETIHLDLPPLAGALGQRLQAAGVPTTPGRLADLARALTLVRPITRRRLYWTARAVLVSDPAQVSAFDRVFFSIFGEGDAGERFDPDETRTVATAPDERPTADHKTTRGDGTAPEPRLGASAAPPGAGDEDGAEVEVPLAMASDEERLADKSFDVLEPHELAQLYRLMTRLRLATPRRRTRRYEKGRHGQHIDLRRTLRTSLRTGGDPIRLARRHRRVSPRRLVMLCDISGSMEPYARAYLQFLTCAAGSGPNAEAFVFATRLTRLTRALASRHPERAIQRAAAAAPDWSSGTRIGDALKAFNDHHGRRGMARGAVVVILSDGWERGDPRLVGREMARLARLAHRIVWVNPRVGASAFSVQAGGMVAALPHCDALVSGHSFTALGEVAAAIGADTLQRPDAPPPAPADEGTAPEPWASATPVPGSSVAMPSGHGPSKGNTTPGWVTDDDG
ncbi:MAG TPA: VWA domain-containing protein [Solirubrobacteraceae bacterium]|nr:VWA domain-containing protein [Solirubrobacteraceae bacterium]